MVRCAVIKTGGKQYRVVENETVVVEKLLGEVGERVALGQVLMIKDGEQIYWGDPCVEGSGVTAQIVQQGRGKKIIVFKHKRRKNYRKKQGHRQYFTKLRIENISLGRPVSEETEEKSVSSQESERVETNTTVEPTENMPPGEVIENGS
jgi:large subunit ribosomal protein L21